MGIKITPKRIGECIAEPDSDFMMKHGECVGGTLTDTEKATSENMLRTWTNFAIHGIPNPETNPADGPPAQFIEQWTADNPVYMRFGSDGVSVQKNYKLTYNIALDEDDEKKGQTTTPSNDVSTTDNAENGQHTLSPIFLLCFISVPLLSK